MKKYLFLSAMMALCGSMTVAFADTGPKTDVHKKAGLEAYAVGVSHAYEICVMDMQSPMVIDICSTYGIAYEDMLTTQHAYRKMVKVWNFTIEPGCGRSLGGGYLSIKRLATESNS